MAYIKQFLTKTRPSDSTSIFRYSPSVDGTNLEMYSLVSISNDSGVETSRFNKFVWDGFIDGFLQKEGDIITRLKNALIGAEFKLRELIRHDDLLEDKGVVLDFSAVVFNDNKVYIAVLGDHKVLMYKKKTIDLSQLLIDNKSNVGSMLMSQEDVLLFYYSKEKLDKNLSEESELEEFLTKVFDNEEARGGAFLAFLDPVEEEDLVVSEPQEPFIKDVGESPMELESKEVGVKNIEKEDSSNELESKEDVVKNIEKEEPVEEKSIHKEESLKEEKDIDGPKKDKVDFKVKFKEVAGKVGLVLKGLFRKTKSNLQGLSAKRFARDVRSIRVGGYRDKQLRTRRFVTLGICLVLLFTIFLGVRSGLESRESRILGAELQEVIEKLDKKVDKAEKAERDESVELIVTAHKDFNKYTDELEEKGSKENLFESDAKKLQEFSDKLQSVYDKVFKIIPLSEDRENMEMFLDTRLTFGENSNPVNLTITKPRQISGGEYMYVLDQGEKAVFEVCINTGNERRISDPENLLSNPLYLDMSNDSDINTQALYIYDAEAGVVVARRDDEMRLNNLEPVPGMSSRTLGGEKVGAFAVFAPANYLNFLIPSEARIIRSQSFGTDSYSLPGEFISYPMFDTGIELYGDQYIYVLTSAPNGIKRFVPLTGLSSQINLTGLYDNLKITTGYTGETMDRAFVVFDKNTNRFVYLEKPIEIGAEMRHPGEIVLIAQLEYRGERGDVFKDVRNIVIEHSDKWMFVLDGTKIWKVNISLN